MAEPRLGDYPSIISDNDTRLKSAHSMFIHHARCGDFEIAERFRTEAVAQYESNLDVLLRAFRLSVEGR